MSAPRVRSHLRLVLWLSLSAAAHAACGGAESSPPEEDVVCTWGAGALVLTELRVPLAGASWLELYNAGDAEVDLRGLRVIVESGACSEARSELVVGSDEPVRLAPGAYAVLAAGDPLPAGAHDLGAPGFAPPPSGARIRLVCEDGGLIDSVCFGLPCGGRFCESGDAPCALGECVGAGGCGGGLDGCGGGAAGRRCVREPRCPECPDGESPAGPCGGEHCWAEDTVFPPDRSLALDAGALPDDLANDAPLGWAAAPTSPAEPLAAVNACREDEAPLGRVALVTEIMANPCGAEFQMADWFEITNVSGAPLDLAGWTLAVGEDRQHRVAADASLVVAAGEAVVVGGSGSGLLPDHVWPELVLLNGGANRIAVFGPAGELVDEVAFDWDFVDGVAFQLSPDTMDTSADDAPRLWCPATTAFDDCSLGTPGAPNPPCGGPGGCGDGSLATDGSEECDDGAANSDTEPDACRRDCRRAWCGDGVLDPGHGEVCDDGPSGSATCTTGCRRPDGPVVRGVVITEIMRNPADTADRGEWIELHNPTATAFDLAGCILRVDGADAHTLGPLVIEAGGYVVLARTGDAEFNGGLAPDYVYGPVSLSNTEDQVVLVCGDSVVDEVAYSDRNGWPDSAGASMSLDPAFTDAAANDDPTAWCDGTEPYGDGVNQGTPGAANPPCVVGPAVAWCRHHAPRSVELSFPGTFEATGRVLVPGLTDRSDGLDPTAALIAEAGYGPDGSDPVASPVGWTWVPAEGNPTWSASAAGEPGRDEYRATVAVPPPGSYDLAFRFSADGGYTWIHCDGDARSSGGGDGSADGYRPEDAGSLVSVADACVPGACVRPPAPWCEDQATLVRYDVPGACAAGDDGIVCTYDEQRVRCPCAGGMCTSEGETGEIIFSEVMYNPASPLLDIDAEWFELYNTTDWPQPLDGCTVSDGSFDAVSLSGIVMAPGGHALLVHSADPAANGGLAAIDGTFSLGLNNTGDELVLACGGVIVDRIAWESDGQWPAVPGASLSLHPAAHDAFSNDDPANWYVATERYFDDPVSDEGDNYGTPRAPNPVP